MIIQSSWRLNFHPTNPRVGMFSVRLVTEVGVSLQVLLVTKKGRWGKSLEFIIRNDAEFTNQSGDFSSN